MYERIHIQRNGPVLRIALNRPEQLNCWDTKLNDELFGALDQAADDPSVRIIVFTGTGRSFCAGGDIEAFAGLDTATARRDFLDDCLRAFTATVLDGKAIKRVAKRLKLLRGIRGGVLGGKALVALELPEVTENERHGNRTWSVAGKGFAWR